MKVVVITGVSRGIGKALAERFIENGDFVIGTSKNGLADFDSENIVGLKLDLADPKSIEKCVGEIKKLDKNIDILINNAGIWAGIDEGRDEDDPKFIMKYFRETMEVNVFGTADFTEQLLPLISEGGHIVNISTRRASLSSDVYTKRESMALAGAAAYPDYRISKVALNMITKLLAERLRGKVTVSSVHPGWVKTDLGGDEAELEPSEVAEDIFKLANSDVESGQFWYKGEKLAW